MILDKKIKKKLIRFWLSHQVTSIILKNSKLNSVGNMLQASIRKDVIARKNKYVPLKLENGQDWTF